MLRVNIGYGKWSMLYESDSVKEGVVGAYRAIGDAPFQILGIDIEGVREAVKGGSFEEALRAGIAAAGKCSEYAPLCESAAVEQAAHKFIGDALPDIEPKTKSGLKNRIFLVNDTKEWVVVKKMTAENVGAREVAAFLLGLKASLLKKCFEFYRDYEPGLPQKIMKGARKGVPAVVRAYENCGGNPLLFAECVEAVNMSITPTHDVLKKVFPEVKLPGIRGRMPKG